MSKSRNVRSRYQTHPAHIRVSVAIRDVEGSPRFRKERAMHKRIVRAEILAIKVGE